MKLSHSLAAALSAAVLAVGAAPAIAQSSGGQAAATTALNVRAGPGTGNAVVDVLSSGEVVSVERCQGGWCLIEHSGPDGWASASYLVSVSGQQQPDDGAPRDGFASGNAEATVALNVRSGPGTGYAVRYALYAGESVNVHECRGNWCQISSADGSGWASRTYLTGVDQTGASRPEDENDADFGFSVETPEFSFSIGSGADFDDRPSGNDGEVCFYEDFNYSGASFCAEPGDSDPSLGQFNDRISAIRVSGGAEVQVCEDFNYEGRCAVITSDRAQITGRNNDIISSYRVR